MNDGILLTQANAIRLPYRDGAFHLCVESPPYYGLRVYDGLEPQVWPDGWRGHLGNEPTLGLYVEHLVAHGREVRRVLRDDGLWALNLGDSFANNPGNGRGGETVDGGTPHRTSMNKVGNGLKPKDKILVPHEVARALRADGWFLRVELPWVKMNGLPESVGDRPSVAHEYVFLLAKSGCYWWDGEAVKRVSSQEWLDRAKRGLFDTNKNANGSGGQTPKGAHQARENEPDREVPDTRQYRTSDAWLDGLDHLIEQERAWLAHLEDVRENGGLLLGRAGDPLAVYTSLQPYPGSHFAVFPPALVTDLIRGGCPAKTCPECGKGWERVVERNVKFMSGSGKAGNKPIGKYDGAVQSESGTYDIRMGPVVNSQTIGWRPACLCGREDTVPGLVLDAFCGSGTVGKVCNDLDLLHVGADLSAQYLAVHAAPRALGRTTAAALVSERERTMKKYEREDRPVKAKDEGQAVLPGL